MNTILNEYINYVDQHQDYILIMEEYAETELFKESLLFLKDAFPEWKTNKGIGSYAGEFMLQLLRNNNYLQNRSEYSQREMLINLYNEIVLDYNDYKQDYHFVFNSSLLQKFENEYSDILEEKEHLEYDEFSAFYDLLFEKFKTRELVKVTYNFEDGLIGKSGKNEPPIPD